MQRQMLVVSHTYRKAPIEATRAVLSALLESGVCPVMDVADKAEFAPHLDVNACAVLGSDVQPADIELVIALGGDGTILRAAELVRGAGVPILGVNLGHIGFLAELERHELGEAVERALAGEYTVEERVALEVCVVRDGVETYRSWALNEATVEKQQRMIDVSVSVDKRPLTAFGCDGIVMSSPTGSTAYGFSAGGPIIWPGVRALLVVPIAAHALFNRPFIVGPGSVVETRVLRSAPAYLWCDGRRKFDLEPGSVVMVQVSDEPVRLARLDETVFTERLVRKFNLPVAGLREIHSGIGAEISHDSEGLQA